MTDKSFCLFYIIKKTHENKKSTSVPGNLFKKSTNVHDKGINFYNFFIHRGLFLIFKVLPQLSALTIEILVVGILLNGLDTEIPVTLTNLY